RRRVVGVANSIGDAQIIVIALNVIGLLLFRARFALTAWLARCTSRRHVRTRRIATEASPFRRRPRERALDRRGALRLALARTLLNSFRLVAQKRLQNACDYCFGVIMS